MSAFLRPREARIKAGSLGSPAQVGVGAPAPGKKQEKSFQKAGAESVPSDLRVTQRRKLIRASHRHRLRVIVDFSKGLSCFLPSKHLGGQEGEACSQPGGDLSHPELGTLASTCSGHTRLGLGRLSPQGGGGPGLAPVTGLAKARCREGAWAGPPSGFRHVESPSLTSSLPSLLPKVSGGGLGPGKNSEQEAQCGWADRGVGERQQGLEGAKRKEPGRKGAATCSEARG